MWVENVWVCSGIDEPEKDHNISSGNGSPLCHHKQQIMMFVYISTWLPISFL